MTKRSRGREFFELPGCASWKFAFSCDKVPERIRRGDGPRSRVKQAMEGLEPDCASSSPRKQLLPPC